MNTDQFIATLNESGLLADACEHLDKCMSETKKTGRGSVVVLRIAVKIEKESGDTIAVAKVSAKWPKGIHKAEEEKGEGEEIARIADEVEGQTKIGEVIENMKDHLAKHGATMEIT
jgi:hypothetical protein